MTETSMSPAAPWAAPSDHRWLKHYDRGVPPHLDVPRVPLYQFQDDSAARKPNGVCLRFFGQPTTFQQIKAASDRFAASLRKLGVKPGDRVALLLPNSPQFVIAYYGILKAGGVVVPLNPLYTVNELSFHFTDSEARVVVTLPMFLDKVTPLRETTPLQHIVYARLADFLPFPLGLVKGFEEGRQLRAAGRGLIDFKRLIGGALPRDFRPAPVDPDDLALLIYSGGTTGVAKGIMLSHAACVANAYQIKTWGQLNDGQKLLAVLPLFHGFGMSVTMNAPMLVGGEVILLPRFSAKDTLKAIQTWRPNFFIGVPTMFVAFNSVKDIEQYNLRSVEGIFVGAAPLTRAIKEGFESRTGARMIEGYGLTEAVTAIMANPYKGTHKVGSIGIPFPDVDMKIVSLEDGRDRPPGELGEIILRSPTLMKGYYKNAEATAQTLRDGWLFTGDIGYMDADGYFYITDRKKELIIVGGFNVFPREVDEALAQHPAVLEAAAVGVPDERMGERVKAVVVLKEDQSATAEEIIAFCRERLVAYKVPAEVEFRSSLPKSMIGKVLRRELH